MFLETGPTDDMMKSGNDLISYGMRHRYIRYHHHIRGLITGIVGTTLEDCVNRRKGLPSDSEDGKTPSPEAGPTPADQIYVM